MKFLQPGLVTKILKSKFFIWTTTPALIIGTLVLLLFSGINDFTVFPNNDDFQYIFYTDSTIGGNSQIIDQVVTDSIIKIDFELHDGISSPYIGVSVASKVDPIVNLAQYNQISIKVRGRNIDNLGVAFITRNPYNEIAKKIRELYFYTTIHISSEISGYHIKIDQLKLPDWWREINSINNAKKIKPDLRNVLSLNFNNAYTPNIGEKQSLEIYAISFTRNSNPLIVFLLAFEFFIILFAFITIFLVEKFRANKSSVTITYKPVEGDSKNGSKLAFIDFINNSFQNSQLSLESVCKETGVSHRKITAYLQKQFACNYKTYVNRLRINESKRLLIDTELNIGEIAFKVGFNNQSHFNRVFKTELRISPTEYREKNKK